MATSKNPKTEIVKDGDNIIAIKIMEEAIVEVAKAARVLLNSNLSRRAVLVLLRDSSGLPMNDIEVVLTHAANLDKKYLKS